MNTTNYDYPVNDVATVALRKVNREFTIHSTTILMDIIRACISNDMEHKGHECEDDVVKYMESSYPTIFHTTPEIAIVVDEFFDIVCQVKEELGSLGMLAYATIDIIDGSVVSFIIMNYLLKKTDNKVLIDITKGLPNKNCSLVRVLTKRGLVELA